MPEIINVHVNGALPLSGLTHRVQLGIFHVQESEQAESDPLSSHSSQISSGHTIPSPQISSMKNTSVDQVLL